MTHPAVAVPAGAHEEDFHDDIIYPDTGPFILVHLACLGAVWTGMTTQTVVAPAGGGLREGLMTHE